jgi:hypothetical protein
VRSLASFPRRRLACHRRWSWHHAHAAAGDDRQAAVRALHREERRVIAEVIGMRSEHCRGGFDIEA